MAGLSWNRAEWIAAVACLGAAACGNGGPQIYGPAYDGGEGGAGDAKLDVASDSPAPQEGGPADTGADAPACSSTVALLGGSATTLFGAGGHGLSGLSAQSLTGNLLDCMQDFTCGIPAAVVPLGTGLFGVLATSAGALESTSFAASWAAPAAIAGAGATIDGPALAAVSGNAELVYQGADYKYYHAHYTQSWSPAAEPVGGSATQSYGARAPGAAAAGGDLVTAQGGADGYLYTQVYTGGAWQAAAQNGSAAVQNTIPPAIVTMNGGGSELLAAYLRITDYKIMSVDRKSGTWSTSPVQVNVNAFTDDPLALAALPGGKALLVYRGSDKKPYFSVWDGQAWSVPAAALGATNPSIASAPSAAAGVCGADAVVAWAETGGGVVVVPFSAGAFGSPQSVAGTSGAKFVALGTLP